MYSQLAAGMQSVGRCLLRGMRHGGPDVDEWESVALDRSAWRQLINKSKYAVEMWLKLGDEAIKGRIHRINQQGLENQVSEDRLPVCQRFDRDCGSRIGLWCHVGSCHRV